MTKKSKLLVGVLAVVLLCSFSFGATVVTVKQNGTGDFTTIQAALDSVVASPGSTIEVQDNGTYTEDIAFTTDSLTLQAGVSMTPKILVTDPLLLPTPRNVCISLPVGQPVIKGFTIEFTGTNSDANSFILLNGGGTKLEDCVINGAGVGIRGVNNMTIMNNVEIKNCGQGVIVDSLINAVYTTCYIHNNSLDNDFPGAVGGGTTVEFNNCTLGIAGDTTPRQVIVNDTSEASLTFNNCSFLGASQRNVISTGPLSTLTFNDSYLTGSIQDEFLEDGSGGTVNFNRTILQATGLACVNISSWGPTTVTIDHCDLRGNIVQWTMFSINASSNVTVKNSIVTTNSIYPTLGNGIHNAGGGAFLADYNDVYVGNTAYGGGTTIGTHEVLPAKDPQYVNTSTPGDPSTFFYYSPLAGISYADEFGNGIGSKGPLPPSAASDWSLYY